MTDHQWALLIVTDQILAEIYKGILESNEIPVFLRSDMTQSVYPLLSDVEILVPEEKLAEASELIESVEVVDEATEDISDEEVDDADVGTEE